MVDLYSREHVDELCKVLAAHRATLNAQNTLIAHMVTELRSHRWCGDAYPESGWPTVNAVLAEYTAHKRSHSALQQQSGESK